MKRIFILSLSIIFLLIGSGMITASENMNISNDDHVTNGINLSENVADRPMLVNVSSGSTEVIRERNDTLGLGGIFKADLNSNVTIMYRLIDGDNETVLRLYADIPFSNFSLTNQTTAPVFSYVDTIVENVTDPVNDFYYQNAEVAYYSVEFNVSNPIIPFTVREDGKDGEDFESTPRNLLTTTKFWRLSTEDDFFIQQENVTITVIANETDAGDDFELKYKVDEGDFKYMNFSLTDVGSDSVGEIALGSFEPGTTLVFEINAYVHDTNMTRKIEQLEHLIIEVGDGRPEISIVPFNLDNPGRLVNETYYTQNGTVSFNFSASVPKGNVSQFEIISSALNKTIVASENASLYAEIMNETILFETNKITNITIVATTNKDLIANLTYIIVVDDVAPTISLDTSDGLREYTSTSGTVIFNFTSIDEVSQVRQVVLDLGNGVKVDVTGLESYSYNYVGFDDTVTYEVILTALDNADNVISEGFVLTLAYDSGISVKSADIWGGTLIFLVAIVVIYFLPKIIEFVKEKLNK